MAQPFGFLVVPVDEHGAGDRAVATAGDLARLMNASVTLLSVTDDEDEVVKRRAELAAVAAAGPVPFEIEVVVGDDIATSIVIGARGATICMATAASLLPHKGHFGSIAEAVVRAAARPVILVGPKADPEPIRDVARVVVPVDGSKVSERALEPAADLANLLGVALWVVTVVSPKDQRLAVATMGGADAAAGESGYVRVLSERAASAWDVDGEFDVLHGTDPADSILDFADDGLIVMTTHGRTGLARLFAGSVTTSVVARAAHPVVVLRPDDETLRTNG